MATFTGTIGDDTASALSGQLIGFTGGTVAELQDSIGDTFLGSDGIDTVTAGAGNDIIDLGNGSDRFQQFAVGYGGIDTLLGGAGDDFFTYSYGTIALNTAIVADTIDGGIGVDTLNVNGGPFDVLHPYSIYDLRTATITSIERLNLQGPVEAVFSGAQFGGAGLASNLAVGHLGGSGFLTNLRFELGSATSLNLSGVQFTGWQSSDLVKINGDGDAESITGTSVKDVINADQGNDTVFATAVSDTIDGGAGQGDTINLSAATTGFTLALSVSGGGTVTATGVGTVTLSNFENVVGGAAGDTLTGNVSTNAIDGGGGNDTIIATLGSDSLDGGLGVDTLDMSAATTQINLTLNASGGGAITNTAFGTMTLTGFENITGGSGDDILTGNGSTNVIRGGIGRDLISATAGGDTLDGGDGAIDRVYFSGATTNITFTFATPGTSQTLTVTGYGTTTLVNFEEFVSGQGNDILTGNAIANQLFGAAGTDTLNGGAGNDVLYGGDGIDTLNGDADNDTLVGEAGNDILNGGTGTDTLNGGDGNDTMNGGTGIDRYYMTTNWGNDTVVGYEDGVDYFHMLVSGVTSFSQLTVTQQGADTLVSYNAGNTILIQNMLAANITAADFLF